ncbi:uncharacterized protein LOC117416525 isoform X1 [Acipenser ruthenus]|uniref:uncharacterized protein LOC117416525 isoform X1 n=1 Tax=Acipenser ruthenus TaxID=7906 RepID=UPI00274043AE|nr:uncharacterized protein LOC117416525 isoform X1 [Acipenser ruthenus]
MTANLVERGGEKKEKRQRELEPDIQSIGKRLRRGVLAPPERILGKPPAGDGMRGITVPGLREEDLLYHSRRDDKSSSNPSIVVRSSLNCGVSLCLNGGTCVPNPVSSLGFFCVCIPSRAGEFCEKSVGGVISYSALALIITGVILILILVLVSCCAIFGLYIKERDRLVSSLTEKGSALGFCSGERPTSQSLNPVSQSHLREHRYSKQSGRSSNAPASKSNAQPATSSVIQSYKPSTATPSSAKQPMPGTNTEMASQWQKAGMQTYMLSGFHGTSTVRKVMPQEPSDDNWSSRDLGTTERTIPTCRAIKANSSSPKTSSDFREMDSEREVEDHSPHLRSSSSPVTYEKLMNMMHIYFEAINTSDPVSPAGPSMEYSKQSRRSSNAPASNSHEQPATSSVKKTDAGPSGVQGTSTVRKVMPQEPSDDNWSSRDLGTANERTIPTCRAIKGRNYAESSNDFREMDSEREVEDHSPHLRLSSSPVTCEKLMNMMHIYFEAINTSDPVSPAGPSMVSPPGAKSCRANSPNMQSFNATAKRSDSTASQCGSAHSSPNSPVINWPVLDSGRHYEHIAHCTWSDSDEESEN